MHNEKNSAVDFETIRRISLSNQAERYMQLKNGNLTGYPDHQEAELALLKILAFYADADPETAERLYRGTSLFKANQWDDQEHRASQLQKAVSWAGDALKTAHTDKTGALMMPDPVAEWPEMLPLTARKLLDFPKNCLVDPIQEYVTKLSEAYQVPDAMVATMTLAVLATAVQGKTRVQIRPGWVEPCNLFALIIAPPAERKSVTQATTRQPLDQYEKAIAERMKPQIAKQAAEKKALQKLADRFESEYAKNPSGQMLENFKEATADAEAFEVKNLMRLTTSDCTPEKLASFLHEQGGKMSVISAEGGIFETLNGRYSKGVNLDVFLAGHAGDRITVDRVGRHPDIIENPALTVCLAAQPEVLTKLQKNPAFRGRGLLGRFLYCIPEPMAGRRKTEPEPMPALLMEEYNALITMLLYQQRDRLLTLDETAKRLLNRYMETLEPKLAPDGEYYAFSDWAGKAAGAAARIAGLLHMASMDEGDRITGQTMRNAITIIEYFTEHAKTALGADDTSDLKLAKKVLQTAKTEGWDELTARLMMRSFTADFETADDAEAILDLLECYGYIREKPQPGRRGRKASRYEINPKFQMKARSGGAE